MSYSLSITDGDLEIDSRGRAQRLSGRNKVAQQINYALSTSIYIQNLFFNRGQSRPSSNESAVRDALLRTINELVAQHQKNLRLPKDERISHVENLRITSLSKTQFSFTLEVSTMARETFPLNVERTF